MHAQKEAAQEQTPFDGLMMWAFLGFSREIIYGKSDLILVGVQNKIAGTIILFKF